MYFLFIGFSIPWIHKWIPEVGFTPEEKIPCLYQIYYYNFWDKLTRQDPKTGQPHGKELVDQIQPKIQNYKEIPQRKLLTENSIKHIANRISIQEGDKDEMINEYLEEVKINLLQNLSEFDKLDTSMKSGTSNDIADAQSDE